MADRADITLRCTSRDMLERLYERHLKSCRLILPAEATEVRHEGTIQVVLPDDTKIVLRATLDEFSSETGTVLRASFPGLTPLQVRAIESQLGREEGPERSRTLPSMRRPELPPEPPAPEPAPESVVPEPQAFTPPPRSSTMPSPRFPTPLPKSRQSKRGSR